MKTIDRIMLCAVFCSALIAMVIGTISLHHDCNPPEPAPVVVETVYKSTCDERMEQDEQRAMFEDYVRHYQRIV